MKRNIKEDIRLKKNEKISIALKGKKKSKEHIEKNRIGHLGQKAWNKDLLGYNKGHKVSQKTLDFVHKRKGKKFEEIYGNERAKEIKEKIKKTTKENMNLDMRNKISRLTKEAMNDEVKGKIREYRAKQILPLKDTLIEVKIQNFLKQLNIDFLTHQYIKEIGHGYQCDILIPSLNLVVECDGDYWHKYPIGRDIDNIRTSELIDKGFRVLRLWECDIKKMELNEFMERLK